MLNRQFWGGYASLLLIMLAVPFSSHAQFSADDMNKMMYELGMGYHQIADELDRPGCNLPVWTTSYPFRVYLVPNSVAHEGYHAGDYIVAINDESVPQDDAGFSSFLQEIGEHDSITVRVYRRGQYLDLQAKCQPARKFARHFEKLGEALEFADAAMCAAVIAGIVDEGGAMTWEMALSWFLCQAIAFPDDVRQNGMKYWQDISIMQMQQLKYQPDRFKAERELADMFVRGARDNGYFDAAFHVEQEVAQAAHFIENDPPPPNFASAER